MKIYTKTGDKGETALCSGERISKNSPRINAYGDIDELSSSLGFAITLIRQKKIKEMLQVVQRDLFALASHVATSSDKLQDVLPEFKYSKVANLEENIDLYSDKLPPLHRFILPGGTKAASALHVARTICRRAERSCINLNEKEHVFELTIPYINRLSDLLFVLARYMNKGKDNLA